MPELGVVTRALLGLRQRRSHLWSQGEYVPLEVSGPLAEHVVAFGWRNAESLQLEVVAAIPRFLHKLTQQAETEDRGWPLAARLWTGTFVQIPGGTGGMLQSVFTTKTCAAVESATDAALEVGPLLQDFPLVVLELADASLTPPN